ncbi:MAG: PepSY domain-containing protein [Pirellulaceae bacterium]
MSVDVVKTDPADTADQAPAKSLQPKKHPESTSLYRMMWRWHFYAGMIVTPFLMVVTITGAIYMFAAETSDYIHQEKVFVESIAEPADYAAILMSAEDAIPGGKATRITMHADPWRTSVVSVTPPKEEGEKEERGRRGRGTSVYVDPYTAKVRQIESGPDQVGAFFRTVLDIHRRLLAGTTGRIVVELCTTWTVILVISGFYLWWPRKKEKVKGVWIPRLSGNFYTVLRDLHTVPGIYLAPICMIILISGLFYTLVWGESFYYVTNPIIGSEVVQEESESRGRRSKSDEAEESYVPPTFELQAAITKARELYPDRDVTLTLPSKSEDHYELSAINDYARGTYGAMDSTGLKLHRDSGEAMEMSDLWNNDRYWWHTWAYPLHVGSVVGMTSKIIWLVACLILVAMPFTGIWMWWKRRPKGKTGFPATPIPGGVSMGVWGTIAVLCFILPTFGLSVLAIVLLDWIVSRIQRTKTSQPA